MSIRYLDLSGAVNFWTNIKNYILSKIPTKTSELTNDSGFLTQHQSLSNYVTLDGAQTISGAKTFSSTITGSVSGNAGTATQFSANKSVTLTGDVTGTASSKAGWSVATTLANSGVTAGTYGPSADVTGSNNATILVPEITVDAKGRVTAVNNRTYTSVNTDSDKKVYQYYKSDDNVYRLLFSNNAGNTATSNVGAVYSGLNNSFYVNPSTGALYATKLYSGGTEVLTSHQSLANYVTTNTSQSISGIKTFPTNIDLANTSTSQREYWALKFSKTDTNGTGASQIGVYQPSNSNDFVACLRLGNPRGDNKPTTGTGVNTGNCWSGIGVYYNYTLNRGYPYAPSCNSWSDSSNADAELASTAWVRRYCENTKGFLTSHPTITLSSNTTSTASPAHGGTFTCIDSVTQDTNGHITKVNTKTITLPADNNTDTKVTQTVTTGNSTYPVLLCATANATATGTTTSRFSAGLTVNTRYSSIYMTNKYDTANTKGVRNTSSYNNGILYFRSYDDTQMGLIRCDSHKSGYQHIYMQASNYIKDGAINPEGTATTCSIAVRVRDNGSKTIYTEGSWENSLTPYANETYDIGTSSLRWMRCYCKNFYGSYVDIAGRYLENEFSTNARTCLYLKSNRDTDGQSGIYFSKFRQNRAQGALTGSDLVSLNLDVLENSVRTNSCIAISFRYFENDVPTKIYVTPKASATSYMGTADNPWTNAYITNLILNGNAFDPASTSGNIGDIVFARAYYSAINNLTMTAGGSALALIRFENEIYVEDRNNQSLSGTWKFLGSTIPTPTSGNASTTCAGVWKRIA